MAELVKIKLTHALTSENEIAPYFLRNFTRQCVAVLSYLVSTYVLRVTRNILYRHINGVRRFFLERDF